MKRVLHLLSSSSFSGAENVCSVIIKNTKEVSFYCSPDGLIKDTLKEKNINYIPIKFNIFNLRRIIKKYKIDIVHAHDYKSSFLAFFSQKKVKIISHIHCNNSLMHTYNIYSFIYSLVQKRFYKIIVVSKEILNDMIFKNKIKNKTIILNNVVDAKKIIKLSKEFNTPTYDILFIGRLVNIKRPLFVIDIVNELKKSNNNIKACIIGNGNLFNECENKIKELNLEDNIDLKGFISNPFPYIASSKVVLLPSTTEGMALTPIESLILNTPVLNSGVEGLKTIFENFPKYICNTKEDYIKKINIILKKDKGFYKEDTKNLSKNFTNIKEYIKIIENIYNS